MTTFSVRSLRPAGSLALGRATRIGIALCGPASALLLSACAPRSCANPYVLDFLDRADARADIAHVGLLYGPVTTMPGPTPDRLSCSVWEQVRRPGDGRVVLRPQSFRLRQINDGWELDPPFLPVPGAADAPLAQP